MKDLTQLHILQGIRRIIRAIDIYSKKLKAEYDMTAVQILCLQTIKDTGAVTLAGLAKLMYVSSSTLVGVVDRLEGKGFIKRERSREDRRYTFIYLTDDGRKKLDEVPPALHDTLSKGLDKMDREGKAELVNALDKVVCLIEAGDVDASPILETGKLA